MIDKREGKLTSKQSKVNPNQTTEPLLIHILTTKLIRKFTILLQGHVQNPTERGVQKQHQNYTNNMAMY